MNNELWVIPLVAAVAGFIYWDYKRVQRMVVPPPPKPAPIRTPVEVTDDDDDEPVRRGVPDWERPEPQITGHEWAQVKFLIASAQLDTASTLGSWFAMIIGFGVSMRWPDAWWAYLPIFFFGRMVITRPFEKALEKARDYMENSNFRW
ncbi:MAG: hypothetical protein WAW73_20470 [Rhodoferax sp.]